MIDVTPIALLLLGCAARQIGVAEDTREVRARAAGEPC